MIFSLEIQTFADERLARDVDLLADRVYDDDRLVDPTIAVEADGSLTCAFELAATDAQEAVAIALERFCACLSQTTFHDVRTARGSIRSVHLAAALTEATAAI